MFFVGLFLAIFLGTGIAVFYPSPKEPTPPTWYTQSEKAPEITKAERLQEREFNQKQQDYAKQISIYNRNVSIIALVFAIFVLIITLALSERLGVVADGLLLGGIFTLLYGIGRGIATDSNQYRFIVAAVGLFVTIALGYIKFSAKNRQTGTSSR
jgi:hypothetical protein